MAEPEFIIPDGEVLFRYVNPIAMPIGQTEIPNSVFEDRNLSCDWKQYMPNPMESYHIKEGKSLIIAITVCNEIKNPTNPKRLGTPVPDWKQTIIHDPISADQDPKHGQNFSHSLIIGKKNNPVTDAIKRHSKEWIP